MSQEALKRVDLHTHSTFSDGTVPPAEVVRRGKSAGLDALVLTDHDSVSGFPEAEAAARELNVPLYCGIEINTSQRDQVHILGYGIRWRDPSFCARLEEFRARRVVRVQRIVENLRKHGLDISFEDVRATGLETLGRPHVADALRRKKIVHSRKEAFTRFLVKGKPGYVDPMGPTPREAIELICGAGGFASVAHPETVKDLALELPEWMACGLEGVETYYGNHDPSAVRKFSQMTADFKLLSTGGTDFHGPGSGRDQGLGVLVEKEIFDRFMERMARCN